jgi:hypothetical protein
MNDAPRRCETHPDLTNFRYGLPHLKAALQSKRKVRIVAIGSSSTAGVAPVLPFPPRLELRLRKEKRFFGRMIDVVNRGIGGQEAPEELSRFQTDVFDEMPDLVIWQVGTNAIYHNYNLDEVAGAIEFGLQWLAGLPADVVLMDLQYTQAMVDKIVASKDMVARIAAAAENADADVNVFRRFALMQRWVDDDHVPIGDLQEGGNLHTGEWATDCITRALFDAIRLAVAPDGTT